MENGSKKRSSVRDFLKAAAIAAVILAVFVGGALAIRPVAHKLFARGFGEAIQLHNMQSMIDAGKRLDGVWRRLGEEIKKQPLRMDYRALLGRWTARVEGPRAAFDYFVELLSRNDPREAVEPYVEFARAAGLAGRWDDCFALCRLLADYGETEQLQDLFAQLQASDKSMKDAFRTRAGLRFIAYANWPVEGGLQMTGEQMNDYWWLQMWRMERSLRRNGTHVQEGIQDFEDIARHCPGDPRAARLLELRRNVASPAFMRKLQDLPAEYSSLLKSTDFSFAGAPAPESAWAKNGAYSARLAQPVNEAWLVARGEPFLFVYPLVIARLDGEASVHYLHWAWYFPEYLAREDGARFDHLELIQVNALPKPEYGVAREIEPLGVFGREQTGNH